MTALRSAHARARCTKCDRVVWLRQVATGSALAGNFDRPIVEWCTRRGTKGGTMNCPAGGYHSVALGDFTPYCPHGCGQLASGAGPDFLYCPKCGDEWPTDNDPASWTPTGAFGRALGNR
jgi:hypothetical protein